MREYFEHAYEGFCNSVEQMVIFAQYISEAAKVLAVYITLPLWVIPYAIYKKWKES